MWISFEPPVPQYFAGYNVSEVVQPTRCERCKAEGKPVNILILISIVSLVLTLAVSNSALWAVERSAKGAWMPTFIVHSNSQTVPDELGIHRSLRMRWFRGVQVGAQAPFGNAKLDSVTIFRSVCGAVLLERKTDLVVFRTFILFSSSNVTTAQRNTSDTTRVLQQGGGINGRRLLEMGQGSDR